MSQHLHRTLLAAVCATTVLGLAACSSATQTSAVPAASTAASNAPSATTATTPAAQPDPNAGVSTGTKLASLLLPSGAVPKSLKADPSGSQNSGDVFIEPSTAAVPTAKACDALGATNWITAAGIGSGSFAGNDFTDSYSDMFAQQIDAFRGSDAHTVIAHLKHVFAECATFKLVQSGTAYTVKLTTKSIPGLGDEAVQAVITSKSFSGGTTLVAARVGNRVVTTLYNDQNTTGSEGVTLTRHLVKNVAAAG